MESVPSPQRWPQAGIRSTRRTSSTASGRRPSPTASCSSTWLGLRRSAERAEQTVTDLPQDLVYAGFSFGAATAQRLAQTRPGARGALLYESCLPVSGEWAIGPWPDGVPVQIHGMDNDPFFALEGDIDAVARSGRDSRS